MSQEFLLCSVCCTAELPNAVLCHTFVCCARLCLPGWGCDAACGRACHAPRLAPPSHCAPPPAWQPWPCPQPAAHRARPWQRPCSGHHFEETRHGCSHWLVGSASAAAGWVSLHGRAGHHLSSARAKPEPLGALGFFWEPFAAVLGRSRWMMFHRVSTRLSCRSAPFSASTCADCLAQL